MCSRYLPCKNTICRRNLMPIPHFLTAYNHASLLSSAQATATAAILVQQTKQISVHGPLDFDLWLLPTVSRSFSNPVDISLSLTQFILSGKPWLSGERQYPDTVMVYFFHSSAPSYPQAFGECKCLCHFDRCDSVYRVYFYYRVRSSDFHSDPEMNLAK